MQTVAKKGMHFPLEKDSLNLMDTGNITVQRS